MSEEIHLLLWDSSEYQEAKVTKGTQASLWIVDGQQRTTALCLLEGMRPYWWDDARSWNKAMERYDVMVNLLPDDGDDRLEFALPNPIRRRDPRWVSVRRVLSVENVEELTPLAQEVRAPGGGGAGGAAAGVLRAVGVAGGGGAAGKAGADAVDGVGQLLAVVLHSPGPAGGNPGTESRL